MSATFYNAANLSGSSVTLSSGSGLTSIGQTEIGSVQSLKIDPWVIVSLYSGAPGAGGTQSAMYWGAQTINNLKNANPSWLPATAYIRVDANPPSAAAAADCCFGTNDDATACGPYDDIESTLCVNSISTYCKNNMNDARCQAWCKSNQQICDPIVTAYCAVPGYNASFCACINSPALKVASSTGTATNPKCVDQNCLLNGYQTYNMSQTACPSIVECNTYNDLVNTGIELSSTVTTAQNCGNPPTKTVTEPTDWSYYIIILILVLMIAGGIVAFAPEVLKLNDGSAEY